jgi:hypothetical protein
MPVRIRDIQKVIGSKRLISNVYLLIFPDELLRLLELLLGLVRPPSPLLRLLATPLPLPQQQIQHLSLYINGVADPDP